MWMSQIQISTSLHSTKEKKHNTQDLKRNIS